ncbi:nuclear transcription factor Y subunit gamma [Ochlerotatus camptorhynchus]|uniref:nuclear transcription factor Y subunit gamma n=1 Tax=Ochlerotatus camptorhynchus TaxID=644619 RepID=UPI0031CFF5E7
MTDHGSGSHSGEKMSEAQRSIEEFWPEVMEDMQRIKHVEPGNQVLPLARIKKIMKLDEDVKMISAEAPLLFAKAAEIFIQELTLRAWLHTEDNKRRTLQRSDIAMAIAKYDQFDFLIDIVPREEIKPVRRDFETKSSTDDVQYYLQLAQQHQQALQGTSGTTTSGAGPSTSGTNIVQVQTSPVMTQQIIQQPHMTQQTQSVQAQTPQITTITSPTTQNIILTNPVTGTATMHTTTAVPTTANAITPTQMASTAQPFQLVQQVLTPSGEVTHIPIPLTQNQLNFIRSQMQLQGAAAAGATSHGGPQPIIIQAPQLQTAPTIIQAAPAGVFLNAAQVQQLQQHQQQQQQQQQHHHQAQTHIIQQSPTLVQQHHHHHHHQPQQQHQPPHE